MDYKFKYEDLELDDIKTVTTEEIKAKWEIYDEGQTVVDDKKIRKVIKDYPDNSSFEGTLAKCKIINSRYYAMVFKNHISSIAEIIYGITDFDERIEKGDLTLVQDIAKKTKAKTGKFYYCFITKYCSWHNQDKFPIYDNIVSRVLKQINGAKRLNLIKRGTKIAPEGKGDMDFYLNYVDVINTSKKMFEACPNIDYRSIDKYFWMAGKTAHKSQKRSNQNA